MIRIDERLLSLSASLVDRALRSGWRDREAILRDLWALQCAICVLWSLAATTALSPPSAFQSLVSVPFAIFAAYQARSHHLRIGSEETDVDREEARLLSADRRSTAGGSRIMDLATIAFLSLAPVLGLVLWTTIPGLRFPFELLCPPTYFVMEAAKGYVMATDPPIASHGGANVA